MDTSVAASSVGAGAGAISSRKYAIETIRTVAMNKNLLGYSKNRELNLFNIESILKSMRQGPTAFTGLVPIYVAHMNKSFILLDGQHRVRAFQRLLAENPTNPILDHSIVTVYIRCSSYDEIGARFREINWGVPVPKDLCDPKFAEWCDDIIDKLTLHFPNVFTKKDNTIRPFISIPKFRERLCSGRWPQLYEYHSPAEVYKIIVEYNELLKTPTIKDSFQLTPIQRTKCDTSGCYLGAVDNLLDSIEDKLAHSHTSSTLPLAS